MRSWILPLLTVLTGCTTQLYAVATTTAFTESLNEPGRSSPSDLVVTETDYTPPASVQGTAPPVMPDTTVGSDLDTRAARVLILQTSHIDRLTEVIGVIDMHFPSGREDEALTGLRRDAALRGADAVLGVEFHHGEGGGESTHLSGLAVKFLPSMPAW